MKKLKVIQIAVEGGSEDGATTLYAHGATTLYALTEDGRIWFKPNAGYHTGRIDEEPWAEIELPKD
jgi:hypothetical protein